MIVERSSKRNLMRLVDLVNFVSRDYAEEKPYEDKKNLSSHVEEIRKRRRRRRRRSVGTKIFGSHARRACMFGVLVVRFRLSYTMG